jgi:hypothetical protein
MKLCMLFSPVSYHFIPFKSKYSQHLIFKHPQSMFSLNYYSYYPELSEAEHFLLEIYYPELIHRSLNFVTMIYYPNFFHTYQ